MRRPYRHRGTEGISVKVLVDTNGLMVPAQHGIDVFEELKRLKSRLRGSDLAALKVALALAQRCTIVEAQGSADDVLAALAKETGSAVFTNDAALRKRLKKEGAKTIFMRSRHMLAVE
jgi:rRNA-processing protein FCF1